MTTQKGKISVQTEDIFPIIKKWLYSEHDIFLRELVANACDAITKRQVQGRSTNLVTPEGKIEVKVDQEQKTLTISDNGIGMSAEEVEKYIAQLAFSGAKEFVEKLKDESKEDTDTIIGKFGLGFYSAFMVSDKVEIKTLSMNPNSKGVHWTCEGQTDYTLDEISLKEVGTEIILHINEESKDFLETWKVRSSLKKHCPFMPYPINLIDAVYQRNTLEENLKAQKEEDKKPLLDDIINNTKPIWNRSPQELKDDDYINFFKELYPMESEPLFWIHLNVDHPFNLQGVLYFPKIDKQKPVTEKNLRLYARQVFVSDNVKDIIPEFLGLLKGAIDSPDIPLNVSRSSLQGDPNIKKISNYIVKKVAESLKKLFKTEREKYENIWEHISLFVKYGIITDQKFAELTKTYLLFENQEEKLITLEEYKDTVPKEFQGKLKNKVLTFQESQKNAPLLVSFKEKLIPCLKLDDYLDTHLTQNLEMSSMGDEEHKIQFFSIDQEYENLFESSQEVSEEMKSLFETALDSKNQEHFTIEFKGFDNLSWPAYIKQDQQMKRFKQMSQSMGQQNDFKIPQTLVVNPKHPLVAKTLQLWQNNEKELASELIHQINDLSLLSLGELNPEQLNQFMARTQKLMLEV